MATHSSTTRVSVFKHLSLCLLLIHNTEVFARPNPQDTPEQSTTGPVPVTQTATTNSETVIAVFTPTSISISGLSPPITEATTVTSTNDAGDTVAIAVAAGAGVVGAGGLAAWLFSPKPGAPPAPTDPPSYQTSSQDPPQTTTVSDVPTSTTEEEQFSCPFTGVDPKTAFTAVPDLPEWTADLPSPTSTGPKPKCVSQGSNNQLLREINPSYVNALASVFCKEDLGQDQSKRLGYKDLTNKAHWNEDKLSDTDIEYSFKYSSKHDGCAKNCVESFSSMLTSCQYNSHVVFGEASLESGRGTYGFKVVGEPRIEKTCKGNGDKIYVNYAYRDDAIESIKNFCKAWDGKTIKQDDDTTWAKERAFSVIYDKDNCKGSGKYKITEKICKRYLLQTVDDCNTDSINYKRGGVVKDTDNCVNFEFHPKGEDIFACYPDNVKLNYITGRRHIDVPESVATDAIDVFCRRSVDGQTVTLDPDLPPHANLFIQDTCTAEGRGNCGVYYRKDYARIPEGESVGDIRIEMSASYVKSDDQMDCAPRQKYEIHGDRCRNMLKKVLGSEPKGMCGSSEDKKSLGSFLEKGMKGCVQWDMWAIATR